MSATVKELVYRTSLAAAALAAVNVVVIVSAHLVRRDPIFLYDPVLGWRLIPDLEGARKPYYVYTDIHGFRIDADEPRARAEYDVMMLGDSFCFGSGVEAYETLAGLLRRDHPRWRIANTGEPGYGTDQELLMLSRFSTLLRPGGAIVLLTYYNDFEDIRARWNEVNEKPWFELSGGQLKLHPPDSPWNTLLRSLRAISVTAELAYRAVDPPRALYGDDAFAARLYEALVRRMVAIAEQRDASFVVVYTSGRAAGTDEGRKWARVTEATAAHLGAGFISLDDNPAAARADLYTAGDIHWTPEGTRVNYAYLAARRDQLGMTLEPKPARTASVRFAPASAPAH